MLQPSCAQVHQHSDANSQDDGRSLWPAAASVPPPPPAVPALREALPLASASRLSVAALAIVAVLALLAFRSSPAGLPGDSSAVRVNGAPSHKESGNGKPVAWLRDSVTITLDPSLEQAGAGIEATRAAFGAWLSTDAHLPQLAFDVAPAPGGAKQDGVNRVLIAPIDMPGHQKDLSIAISYIDEATGEILEVDIILNAEYRWTVLSTEGQKTFSKCGSGTYDLQNVAAHEAGHFFGLGEDKKDSESTMFFQSGSCETNKRDLEPADAQALVTHYELAAEAREDAAGCSVSSESSTRPGFAGMALALIGLVALRRRSSR